MGLIGINNRVRAEQKPYSFPGIKIQQDWWRKGYKEMGGAYPQPLKGSISTSYDTGLWKLESSTGKEQQTGIGTELVA